MVPLAWLRNELSFSRWTWTRGDGTASLDVEEQVEYQLFGVTLDFNQEIRTNALLSGKSSS
jgi:hypothetical protein